jgi:hypothetical protein
VQKNYALSTAFQKDATTVFRSSGGESIDFNNREEAADTINQWVNHNNVPYTILTVINYILFTREIAFHDNVSVCLLYALAPIVVIYSQRLMAGGAINHINLQVYR